MDANKDTQTQMKKIPLFTVLKNGSILKNIFLLRKRSAVDKSSSYQESDEEILLVGRHPHCNITLEHPSISRYHLRIHSNPYSHTLSIVDLSSVHGTWVSGKRIEPGAHVNLKEGDTVKIGGSSRVYELHWVPQSQAYDVDEQFVPAVYTIQEVEEETNKDEKLETQLPDVELESPNLSLCNKSHHDSPVKISSARNYFNSYCDDTVSVQAPLLVSETKSASEITESLNNSEDELDWLRDNLSYEIEAQNDRIVKDGPLLVSNCSKSSCDDTEVEHPSPWNTGNENGELFTTVPGQAVLVVSEDISETEISGCLNSSENELNLLRDNLSNEFELEYHGIMKEQLSVPSCSKSSCDDTDSSPCKTGHGNGEFILPVPIQAPPLVSVSEIEISDSLKDQSNWVRNNSINELAQLCHETMNDDDLVSMNLLDAIKMHKKDAHNQNISDDNLNKSEDELNCLRSNLSNEFELQNDGFIKEDHLSVPSCSKSSFDDAASIQPPPLVSISEIEISDNLKDQSNWARENLSNELEQLFHGTMNDNDLVSIDLLDAIKKHKIDSQNLNIADDNLNKSEDQQKWLRDNLTNEFELQGDGINKEEQLSVPSCSKSSCDDTDTTTCSTGNENGKFFLTASIQAPPLVSISEIEIADSLKDQSNWARDNLSSEFEQLCHGTMNDDDLLSMDLLDSIKMHKKDAKNENISDDKLNKSEDQLYWLRDNLINEFELQNDGIIKEEHLSLPSCSKSSCDDTDLTPCEIGNGNGNFFLTASIQAPQLVSIPEIEISDSLKDQSNWVKDNLSNEYEQLCFGTMNDDDLVSMDPLDAIKMLKEDAQNQNISDDNLNKSEDQFNWLRDNLSNDFKQLRYGIMKADDLVSVDLSDANKAHGKNALKNQYTARSKEVDMANESEQENQQKIGNLSVPVALLVDGVNRDEESFLPEVAGCKVVNMCCELDPINHKELVFQLLTDGIDMHQEQTFTPNISKAHVNLDSMKNVVPVSLNLFDSLHGNGLELHTLDKENKNPNAGSGKPLLKRWKEDEHNHFTMSTKAISPTIYKEKDISDFSKQLFTSVDKRNIVSNVDGGMYTITDPFVYCEEVSLSSLERDTKSREMKMEESSSSNYPQTIQKAVNSSHDLGKKRWAMVVDTDSLLHYESLKHLKLLEGLKGTQLFVPRTVIRELMDIKSQDNFLKKSTKKVDLALKWIEECMVNTRPWIHLDDEILPSSKSEPEVLETALHLHKEITNPKIIILSNDLTLKIKAMAEGIMCEGAEEFFRSLVNPFSERFMWVGSSARGPTWSFVDDDIMRQKYEGHRLYGSHKLKGLRLLAQY